MKDTGTTITFWPDEEIFTETVEFSRETLARRFREMAFLNKGAYIEFIDHRPGKEFKEIYHYKGGIQSYVEFINRNKKPIHDKILYIDEIEEETDVEIAIQYTAGGVPFHQENLGDFIIVALAVEEFTGKRGIV